MRVCVSASAQRSVPHPWRYSWSRACGRIQVQCEPTATACAVRTTRTPCDRAPAPAKRRANVTPVLATGACSGTTRTCSCRTCSIRSEVSCPGIGLCASQATYACCGALACCNGLSEGQASAYWFAASSRTICARKATGDPAGCGRSCRSVAAAHVVAVTAAMTTTAARAIRRARCMPPRSRARRAAAI